MPFSVEGTTMTFGGVSITSADLSSLISAIPIAKEGDIITPDYHNSLRAALLALASQAGVTPGGQALTLNYPPQFVENDGGPNWSMTDGAASIPNGATNANGWFAVQAPDGARLDSMVVYGNRSGTIPSFQVRLVRQTIADGNVLSLVTIQLKDASSPFKVSGTVNVQNAGPAALEEYRRIDNENYNYLVAAKVTGASAGAIAQITSIQLIFSKG